MKKVLFAILVLSALLIAACNLQVQTVPPAPTPASFASVDIPKPDAREVGKIVITGVWTDEDLIKVNINYTGDGTYRTIDYKIVCDEHIDDAQSGNVKVNDFVEASCHGSSYEVYIQGRVVWQAAIKNRVVQPVGSYTGYVYYPAH